MYVIMFSLYLRLTKYEHETIVLVASKHLKLHSLHRQSIQIQGTLSETSRHYFTFFRSKQSTNGGREESEPEQCDIMLMCPGSPNPPEGKIKWTLNGIEKDHITGLGFPTRNVKVPVGISCKII